MLNGNKMKANQSVRLTEIESLSARILYVHFMNDGCCGSLALKYQTLSFNGKLTKYFFKCKKCKNTYIVYGKEANSSR